MQIKTEPFVLNMGPQHPSTHGVFRMLLTLDGETVVDAEPVVGYLHRGTEKLAEGRTYLQCIPYTDRLDYLASMSNNLAYVLAVEKLAGIVPSERAMFIRVIMAELTRLASHLVAIGTWMQDLGCMASPLMYMFREREKIMDLFEMTCGARLTVNYMRFGGVSRDVPEEFLPALRRFVGEMPRYLDEYEQLITSNEIVLARSKGVGVLPRELAIDASTSGPVLRGSGVRWDLRKNDPYEVYDRFEFEVPVGQNGDCYDRYWVRMQEMRQSVRILEQAMEGLPGASGKAQPDLPILFRPPVGEAYARVEAPKGELGFYVVSDGSISPYRYKIRSPSFINLTVLRDMVVGYKVADAVITLGSLDIVLGEVDR